MVGIRREEPLAHAAGHRVQVVAVVSRCGGDDMVAAGNEDKIIVTGADRDIEVSRFRIDTLEGEALLRVEAVVIDLLEGALDAGFVLVVLMRWKGRPVARRGEDFDQKEPRRGVLFREDPVDASFGDALAPHLDADLVRPDQAGGERRLGGSRDDRQVQRRLGAHAIARTGREQQGSGFTAKHVLALAHLAKAVDIRRTPEPDERRLLVAGFTGELLLRLAPDRPKGQVGPPRGRGADPFSGVAEEAPTLPSPASGGGGNRLHRPRARRKARLLLSSSAAASGGVSGPGITSCSTTSQPW